MAAKHPWGSRKLSPRRRRLAKWLKAASKQPLATPPQFFTAISIEQLALKYLAQACRTGRISQAWKQGARALLRDAKDAGKI